MADHTAKYVTLRKSMCAIVRSAGEVAGDRSCLL